jgi:multidrug resistance efflux pump
MKTISSRNYINSMRVHFIPIVVWLGTVVIVVALFSHRSRRYELAGVAQGQIHQIAATCTGRLESVSVELFDKVTKGQVLAVVNGVLPDEPTRFELGAQVAALQASIAQISAETKAARAEYIADVNGLKTEWAADGRSFATDASDTEERILELTTEIETDQALSNELDVAIKRFLVGGGLNDGNDVAVFDLKLLQAQRATFQTRIEHNKRVREQLQRELKAMVARESEFKSKHEPYLGTSDEQAEEVRIRQMEALEREKDVVLAQLEALEMRAFLELKSPIDGIIIPIPGNSNEIDLRRPGENLLRRAGEVVRAGEPIFAVVETEPHEIVAYVNERQLSRVREGTAVRLIKNTEPAQMAISQVTYVSPVLERMPERLWVSPAVPQWGRAVLIGVPPGLELVSGELVGIRGL